MAVTSLKPARSLLARFFLTCWLVLVLHFATDIVREHYLAFSLAEHFSFRMDEYLGLHVDIFDTPGYGAHIGNNPGVSMLGAIPYAVLRPAIDQIARAVNERRAASGQPITAIYRETRPRRVEFYRKVRERGLDIQFGLAAAAMQAFLMAPLSALAGVVMLLALIHCGVHLRMALLLAFLYVLGTPILFRSAFLNQNLLIAHLVLFAFVVLWCPGECLRWPQTRCWIAAGFCGGFAVLSDYSGLVVLAWLALYAMWRAFATDRWRGAVRSALWYALGASGPIVLLLFYQWRSFGSPWYPGQSYMPDVEWVEVGYRGVALPSWELFTMLLFDSRFGLFIACPLLALAIPGLYRSSRNTEWLAKREALFLFGFALAFIVFFSAVQYTRLQYVTGIRYIVPVIPALFLLTAVWLTRLPAGLLYAIVVLAFAESWCLAMARARYVSDSFGQVFLGGFQLPWMTVLSKMSPQYFPFMETERSPLPIFVLSAALLYGLWTYPERDRLG